MTAVRNYLRDKIDAVNSRLAPSGVVEHARARGCRRYARRKWCAVNLCNTDLCPYPRGVILFQQPPHILAPLHCARIVTGYRRRGIIYIRRTAKAMYERYENTRIEIAAAIKLSAESYVRADICARGRAPQKRGIPLTVLRRAAVNEISLTARAPIKKKERRDDSRKSGLRDLD